MRAQRVELVLPFLQKYLHSNHSTLPAAPVTYSNIIRAYGRAGDVDGAWSAWRAMLKRDVVPLKVTLGCMMQALMANGQTSAAKKLVDEMNAVQVAEGE